MIALDARDRERLAASVELIAEAYQKLGLCRVEFLQREQRALDLINTLQQQHDALMTALGRDYLAGKPGNWTFDTNASAFVASNED